MLVFWYVVSFARAILIFSSMIIWMLMFPFASLIHGSRQKAAFALRRHWLKNVAIPVLGLKVEFSGAPIDKPALYVSNHRSFADPIVLCRFVDAFVVAKAEVKKYPIINIGAMLTGVIFVQRENEHSRKKARSKLLEILEKGYNVLVYPEGTVGIERGTLPFKTGSFKEAAENQIPVIPVAIEYKSKRDLWVIPQFLKQYFYQFAKPYTPVKLSFGPELRDTDGLQLKDRASEWINEQLANMQQGWSEH